jgi:O-antigen/teichoic acid export membrane protein
MLNLYGKGISFIGTVIIIRILGREAFGEFGMLNTTISMFGMFTTFSISQTATKYIAQFRDSDKDKTGRIIGLSFLVSISLGIIVFIIVTVFADALATKSLNAPHLSGFLKLMAIGLLFGAANGVQNGIISGFEAFKTNALIGIISGTILTSVKVLMTYLYGFKGAIIGMTLEPVYNYLITFFVTRKIMHLNQVIVTFKGALTESKILINYSLPSLLSGLTVLPTNWFTLTILEKSGGGYHEVGAYNAANQWYNVLIFIPYILVSTFLPIFSGLLAKSQKNEINRIIKNSIILLATFFILLSLIFLIFGEKITLIYGKEFEGTGFLLAVAVFSLLPQSINIILGNFVAALGKMWFGFWVNFIWCIVFMVLTYLFISKGALGLLLARLGALVINLLLMLSYFMNWQKSKSLIIN